MGRITVKADGCSLYVVGMEMNCPLCKKLVRSGDRHQCGSFIEAKPEKPKKKKAGGKLRAITSTESGADQ